MRERKIDKHLRHCFNEEKKCARMHAHNNHQVAFHLCNLQFYCQQLSFCFSMSQNGMFAKLLKPYLQFGVILKWFRLQIFIIDCAFWTPEFNWIDMHFILVFVYQIKKWGLLTLDEKKRMKKNHHHFSLTESNNITTSINVNSKYSISFRQFAKFVCLHNSK